MATHQRLATVLWLLALTIGALVALAGVVALVGLVPLLLAVFPITIALVAGVILIGWLRWRRRHRG